MKRFFYHILLNTSLLISKLGLSLNLPIISAIGILINLRFLKSKSQSKKKNILVLEKSHGIDDIKQLIKSNLDKEYKFILLSRSHLKIIYNFFDHSKKGEKFNLYINNLFAHLKKIINIDLIISFNLRYKAERILQNLDRKLNIKYLVCQKECLFNEDVLNNLKKYFLKLERFKGDHITVYNKQLKSMFISINYADENKISVVGMNRADNYFNSITQKQEYVLFFLINPETGLIDSGDNFRWDKLAEDTVNSVLDFAEKNQNIKFIFKAKIINDKESYEQQKLIQNRNLKNCKILYGGNAFDLIMNSKLIIAFNSTAIFEALAGKKQVLIPYFINEYREYLDKYIIDTLSSKNIYHAHDINQIQIILKKILTDNTTINYNYSEEDKNLLEKFIGNSDGNSSKRLKKVIEKLIFN